MFDWVSTWHVPINNQWHGQATIMPSQAMPNHVKSCQIMSNHAKSCQIMPNHALHVHPPTFPCISSSSIRSPPTRAPSSTSPKPPKRGGGGGTGGTRNTGTGGAGGGSFATSAFGAETTGDATPASEPAFAAGTEGAGRTGLADASATGGAAATSGRTGAGAAPPPPSSTTSTTADGLPEPPPWLQRSFM